MPALPAFLVAVHIVSAVGRATPDDAPKHARHEDTVTLHALVETRDGWYGDVAEARVGTRTIRPRPFAGAPPIDLVWYKVEPVAENLSNTASGSFAYEAIEYVETEVAASRGRRRISPDVRPTRIPDRGGGLGTMRFKVVARSGNHSVASPGAEDRRGRGSGGLADVVHTISIRRDDSYVGWLTELYGQPYIWASAGATSRTHQSERLEGSDCADFVTYGWRRLGHDVPYTWTEGLRRYTRKLSSGVADAEGIYRDHQGRAIPFPRAGDLALFPRHVGVLVEDRGVAGVLDTADVIAHTLFESPHEEPIADSGYAGRRLEVMRWKK